MTELRVDELWRRAVDANLGYSRAVVTLTTEYVRALASFAQEQLRSSGRSPAVRAELPGPVPEIASAPPRMPTMVLEAAAGEVAVGAFVVENALSRPVETVVVASPFVEPTGGSVVPPLAYDPPEITLGPGQQVVVRVGVTLSEEMAEGRDYAGEFAIPGLPGTRIPVVIRRRGSPRRPARRQAAAKRAG